MVTKASTRRVVYDCRPSRPTRPAHWIQNDKAVGAIKWTNHPRLGRPCPVIARSRPSCEKTSEKGCMDRAQVGQTGSRSPLSFRAGFGEQLVRELSLLLEGALHGSCEVYDSKIR